MKTNSLARLLLVGAIGWATEAAAQQPLPPAAGGGYWNLETNLTTRSYTLVRFYNAHDQLLYEERLDNLCLDLGKARPLRRRLQQRLNLALQQVLAHPALATPHPTLLAQQLSTNRHLQRAYRAPDAQRTLAAVR